MIAIIRGTVALSEYSGVVKERSAQGLHLKITQDNWFYI